MYPSYTLHISLASVGSNVHAVLDTPLPLPYPHPLHVVSARSRRCIMKTGRLAPPAVSPAHAGACNTNSPSPTHAPQGLPISPFSAQFYFRAPRRAAPIPRGRARRGGGGRRGGAGLAAARNVICADSIIERRII